MNELNERGASSVVMFVTQQIGTELVALSPTQIASSSNPPGDAPAIHHNGETIERGASSSSSPTHSTTSPFTITTGTHFVGFSQYAELPLGPKAQRDLIVEPPPDFETFDVIPSDKDMDVNEDDQQISLVVVRYLSDTVVRCKENGIDYEPVTELADPSPATPSVITTLQPINYTAEITSFNDAVYIE